MPLVLAGVDLGALFAALLLIILAAGLWIIAQVVRHSLGHAPLIGPWITTHIVQWIYDARDAVVSAAKATWHAAAAMFTWAERWITNTYDTVILFAVNVLETIRHIVTVQIPAEAARLEISIYQEVSKADTYAHSLFNLVAHYITGEIGYLRSLIDASVSSLEYRITLIEAYALGLARQAVTDAEAYAGQLYGEARAYVVTEIDKALTEAEAGITAVAAAVKQAEAEAVTIGQNVLGNSRAYTDAVAAGIQAGIYTDLNQVADQAVAEAWPDAAREIAGLGMSLGADMPWLHQLLPALGGAGAAGLAGALIRAMAGTQAVTRLAEDCIVPNCRNLSGLGNALAQLAEIGTEAALLAWLAEAIADPAAWARDTDQIVKPLGAAAFDMAKGLL